MSKSFWHMTQKEKRELKEKNPREWERVLKEANDGTHPDDPTKGAKGQTTTHARVDGLYLRRRRKVT